MSSADSKNRPQAGPNERRAARRLWRKKNTINICFAISNLFIRERAIVLALWLQIGRPTPV